MTTARALFVALALVAASAVAACGGGGSGAGSVPGGGSAPTPSSNPATSACVQTPSPSAPAGLSDQASTFFTEILPGAHAICLSAWDLSSDVMTALESAAHNGANVWVIVPYSQDSGSNVSDASEIVSAGGHMVWEYTGSAPPSPWPAGTTYAYSSMDIHAKFALVDGIAYMDGHNWFSSDVIMEDGTSGDYADIQEDLTQFPASPPSNGPFTTDKQQSLQNEAAYITAENPQPGQEYDFISEDFNPSGSPPNYNGAVYNAMCAAAANGATVHVVVEDFGDDSTAAQAALTNLLLLDPNASVRSNAGGLEKISMVRGASMAWFGSSNDSTTDLIDWGMTLRDASVIAALQSYYDSTFAGSSPIPSPSPGATASPCP